jgi:hypothetical protein
VNEDNAIKYLRGLLNSPATTREDGKPDPGWCCNEHSVVAALAFAIRGHKTFLCSGSLLLGDIASQLILGIDPHWFIIVSGFGVFDSSVTSDGLSGIPCAFAERYPHLAVCGGEHVPTQQEFTSQLAKSRKRSLAWYSSSKMSLPGRNTVEWISSTLLGEWITSRYGSQVGIWSKAAWQTAEILRGAPLPTRLDRDSLWDATVSAPDRNKAVLDACSKFTNET